MKQESKRAALLTGEPEPPRKPSRLKKVALRVVTAVLAAAVMALAYVFLLLGEPDEDAKYAPQAEVKLVDMPMTAVETPGEANVQNLADTFGEPVLNLFASTLNMQRARVFDTAYQSGYARRVTLTYAFDDGALLTLESVRPAVAITLLETKGYTLDPVSLYTLGGLDAALMSNGEWLLVFGQTESAAYAVRCPASHAAELNALLKQTVLTAPQAF